MKYAAWIRAWRENEFQDLMKKTEAEAKEAGRGFNFDVAFEKVYKDKTQHFIFEASSYEEAHEIARRKAVDAGAPPVREWGQFAEAIVHALPYSTARELLESKPTFEDYDSIWSWRYSFFEVEFYRLNDKQFAADRRVRTAYYGDFNFDGIRGWTLCAVFFDGKPVSIFQSAGRDNRDHRREIVVSYTLRREFVQYLISLVGPDENEKDVSLDAEDASICFFYGDTLGDLRARNEK